jgi:hypothetical protein
MSSDAREAVGSNAELGPVAWKFMQATYGEGDVRGRGWMPALKFTRPEWEVMQKDVQPLFTRAQLDAEVAAERERGAAKCLRPARWLREDQQRLVDEIRAAILSGA